MGSDKPASRSPFTFVGLVFALSIPFWLIEPVAGEYFLALPLHLPVSALQIFCPFIAALILMHREEPGRLRRLPGEIFDLHKIDRQRWYLPIFFLMPVVMVLSYGLMVLGGKSLPEPRLQLLVIPLISVVFFLSAAVEEVGWMGYAAGPLQDRWNALTTAVLLGVIWALWHLIPYIQANHSTSWIIWQCVATVALRVLIFWVYNNTAGSLFAATLFHTGINVNNALFPENGSAYDPAVSGAILVLAAAVVTYLWGRHTLARFRYDGRVGKRPPPTGVVGPPPPEPRGGPSAT